MINLVGTIFFLLWLLALGSHFWQIYEDRHQWILWLQEIQDDDPLA